MRTQEIQPVTTGNSIDDVSPPGDLPPGSEIRRVSFVAEALAGQHVLLEFDAPSRQRAVLVNGDSVAEPQVIASSLPAFTILTVPARGGDEPEASDPVRAWVDSTDPGSGVPSVMMLLHGAQVFWRPGRAAVIAPVDRLEAVRRALVEFAYYEAELRNIEREIGEGWPYLEADSPLAFDSHEMSAERRQELSRRFQRAIALRARLARLAPQVQRPQVHPPTLASQVSERLRERTRLVDRIESSSGQIEIFERVYEMCGHRASEFVLSHKGHNLEWIIIVLLAAQTLLLLVERMSALGN